MKNFGVQLAGFSRRAAVLVPYHEGSLDKALQMVDAAADAGAEIIKFQCHITEKEMIPTDMTPGKISTEKLWDIIKRCELNEATCVSTAQSRVFTSQPA